MTGDLIKDKAVLLLKESGTIPVDDESFTMSNGWLDGFKKRHHIEEQRRFGESGSVNGQLIQESRPMLKEVLDTYDLSEIYNMDETGQFYRLEVGKLALK